MNLSNESVLYLLEQDSRVSWRLCGVYMRGGIDICSGGFSELDALGFDSFSFPSFV